MMDKLPKYMTELNGDLWLTEDERDNLKLSYRVKEVVFFQRSPYQEVMIADSYDFGRMLVLDGVVQTTSLDGFIYNEMISHVPMSFHPCPESILVIGGGDLGVAREICKYSQMVRLDLVEIDEVVVRACHRYLPEVSGRLQDQRVNYIYTDGVAYAAQHRDFYDLIIVDSSDPVGPAKKLFEYEFYKSLYRALKSDGIMVCQSQSPLFHSSVMEKTWRAVHKLFPVAKLYTAVVPTYPGGIWSFTMGSKKYSQADCSQLPKNTSYINRSILSRCFDLPQFLTEVIEGDPAAVS